MNFYLGHLVTRIPSYIKDTTDSLKKLETVGNLPLGMILATLEETPLYTNIAQNEAIEACRAMLNTRDV